MKKIRFAICTIIITIMIAGATHAKVAKHNDRDNFVTVGECVEWIKEIGGRFKEVDLLIKWNIYERLALYKVATQSTISQIKKGGK